MRRVKDARRYTCGRATVAEPLVRPKPFGRIHAVWTVPSLSIEGLIQNIQDDCRLVVDGGGLDRISSWSDGRQA
jgi:hypothetical protein